jgi:hypothetical protein
VVSLSGSGVAEGSQLDVFQQPGSVSADVLFVIDDSASMALSQLALSSHIGEFVAEADQRLIDYQIGVITTEAERPSAGRLWACLGYDAIVRPQDPARVAALECAAQVFHPPGQNVPPNPGTSDGREAGLRAAQIALGPALLSSSNAGFLRPEATLLVIAVSDDDDVSPGTVDPYVAFLRSRKAPLAEARFSAVAGAVPLGCGGADPALRYDAASKSLCGALYPICSSSFGPLLDAIAASGLAPRSSWQLSRPADPASVQVAIDGSGVRPDLLEGWSYDGAQISFHGASVPPANARVEVRYQALCSP